MAWPDFSRLKVPLLWPGLLMTLALLLLVLLQAVGFSMGSSTSVIAAGLACLGMALGWGYLMAGATAGSWLAKLVVLAALVLYIIPIRIVMLKGYTGLILLAGLVVYLVWAWWRRQSRPLTDFLVAGVILLLVFGVVAERTILFTQYVTEKGAEYFSLFLQLQSITSHFLTGAVLLLIGGALGNLAAGVKEPAAARLMRLPSGVLFGATLLVGVGQLGWHLLSYSGPGYLTAALWAVVAGLWIWVARPRHAWQEHQPIPLALVGVVYLVANEYGGLLLPLGSSPVLSFALALYLAGFAALAVGVTALLMGRRSVAVFSGLVGIWLVAQGGNGRPPVPVLGLAPLAQLPKLESQAVYGMILLVLLGWAVWRWVRGRRDAAPYALSLSATLMMLAFLGVDKVYLTPALKSSVLSVLVYAVAWGYCLWILVRGVAAQQERGATAWTGLGLGTALLVLTATYWGNISGLRDLFGPSELPFLGYGMFSLALFGTGFMRQAWRLTAEGRDAA